MREKVPALPAVWSGAARVGGGLSPNRRETIALIVCAIRRGVNLSVHRGCHGLKLFVHRVLLTRHLVEAKQRSLRFLLHLRHVRLSTAPTTTTAQHDGCSDTAIECVTSTWSVAGKRALRG